MRAAWAVALGLVGAIAVTWWLGHEPATTTRPPAADADKPVAPALYRWRDDEGTVQITDRPPPGREYETVDTAALERRNVFDPPEP